MPAYESDNPIHEARLVYLGPTGYTLPWHWPYAKYGLFAVAAVVCCGALRLVTGGWGATGFGLAIALVVTSVIFQYVDADRPVRKVLHTVATDWRRTAPADDTAGAALPRRSAAHIAIGGDDR